MKYTSYKFSTLALLKQLHVSDRRRQHARVRMIRQGQLVRAVFASHRAQFYQHYSGSGTDDPVYELNLCQAPFTCHVMRILISPASRDANPDFSCIAKIAMKPVLLEEEEEL